MNEMEMERYKERGKRVMAEEMSEEQRCIISVFLAFSLQAMPFAIEAFAFCLALIFSPRSCSVFHLWAHFMKKFVNINEGHTGSLLNQGQDRRDRGEKKHIWYYLIIKCALCFCLVYVSILVPLKMFCIHLYLWSLCLSVDTFTSQQQNTSSKALPFHSRLPVITFRLEANHLVIWSNERDMYNQKENLVCWEERRWTEGFPSFKYPSSALNGK